MATALETIYPPQVETFMPSFCYNESAVVWFKIPSYSEDKKGLIQYIHISMVDQRNNQNVFAGKKGNTTVYPQYYPLAFSSSMYDESKKMYKIIISPKVLKGSIYNPNQYYKIQLRFDLTGSINYSAYNNTYNNPTNFFKIDGSTVTADALKLANYTNYNQDNFSEWSTGTLIKPIFIPVLSITNILTDIYPSTDVPIVGHLSFKRNINDESDETTSERLSWYQIKIITNDNNKKERYSSDKILAINNKINYRINTLFLDPGNYTIKIIYETENGYNQTEEYPIQIKDYNYEVEIRYNKDELINEEDGFIKLVLRIDELDPGYLIVRRSSHRSNFQHWDLISTYDIEQQQQYGDTLTIKDDTIESMTGYRYQLQYAERTEGDNGYKYILYKPQYIEEESVLHCDFYGSLFSDKDKKLKISFNFQPSNRANAPNRSKVDTLGGQYPIFTQNSKLKYHIYTINGLISTEDCGESFLSKEEIFGSEYYNYRYNKEEVTDTSILGGKSGSSIPIEKIQPNNDWLYEREYRDAVEEWLNNGKPKLFRSMTEGNMIVMLDSITLTPKTQLGRRLYDFSATMYEIGDGKDFNSIVSFGLFDMKNDGGWGI